MKYSKEIKEKVISDYNSGIKASTLSKNTNISKSTIYKWINESRHDSALPMSQREVQKLVRKVTRLETMLEIIQNTDFFKQVPLNEKLKIADDLYELYGVNVTCDALCIAHGTFHNHQKRGKGDNWLHEKRKMELEPEIRLIFEESNQTYGAQRITAELRNRGYKTSKNTVAKIMHELGLFSVRTKAKELYYKNIYRKKQNILKRDFYADKPNQKWTGDVAHLYVNKTKNTYYLCVVIDLFSRKVISYSIGKNNSSQLVNTTFKKAFDSRHPKDELIFHSDRGSNYTSKSFAKLLTDCNVQHSFSKAGTPYDNSVTESLFATFRRECYYRYNFYSYNDLIEVVSEYIEKYNKIRIHSYLNYKTPESFENDYYNRSDT